MALCLQNLNFIFVIALFLGYEGYNVLASEQLLIASIVWLQVVSDLA